METMGTRISKVSSANGMLRNMYAIMHDASLAASDSNRQSWEGVRAKAESPGLSEVQRIDLDDTTEAIQAHIQALDTTTRDTAKTLGDLSEQKGSLGTMRDRNEQQVSRTRGLLSSGVAGVADRLVIVLNGIAQAALTESSEAAAASLQSMNAKTQEIAGREVIQKVLGMQAENSELVRAVESFRDFSGVFRQGAEVYREEVARSKQLIAEVAGAAEELKKVVQRSSAVHAEVASGHPVAANDDAEPAATAAAANDQAHANPFDALRR
jgi:hypothetical protein